MNYLCRLASLATIFLFATSLRGQNFDDALVTDRPDFTEASSTVGYRRLQIESGYTYVHDGSGGVDLDEHVSPELLLRYGLSDVLELRVAWEGYLSARIEDRNTGLVTTENGGTDLDLGVKLELLEQNGWIPETAVLAGFSIPLGNPNFGSRQVGAGAALAYSWELSETLSFGGNTGGFFGADGNDYFSQFSQSATLGVSLTDRVGIYTEWFTLASDQARDSRPRHFFNGGLAYLVTPNFQLDWRAGVGLNEATEDFFTGVGFSVRH